VAWRLYVESCHATVFCCFVFFAIRQGALFPARIWLFHIVCASLAGCFRARFVLGAGRRPRAPWRRIAAVIVDGRSNIALACIPFRQSLFPHPLYTIVIAWMEIPRLSVSIEIIIFYIFSREIAIEEQPHLPPTPTPPPPIIDDLFKKP
jgi:hypothetical protein